MNYLIKILTSDILNNLNNNLFIYNILIII